MTIMIIMIISCSTVYPSEHRSGRLRSVCETLIKVRGGQTADWPERDRTSGLSRSLTGVSREPVHTGFCAVSPIGSSREDFVQTLLERAAPRFYWKGMLTDLTGRTDHIILERPAHRFDWKDCLQIWLEGLITLYWKGLLTNLAISLNGKHFAIVHAVKKT